ncbi:hypothetical protein TNCV_3978561 [Trichonephila clavipes]|uniref:Uncharacterized protein n=1 Tax=Trichonephila clavipes TaxID=2585209 RepID=A0A8X7BJR6_TRICX|nr:hypothetical protein TNCV_3978561 [Trichonephila clavipes]
MSLETYLPIGVLWQDGKRVPAKPQARPGAQESRKSKRTGHQKRTGGRTRNVLVHQKRTGIDVLPINSCTKQKMI